MKPQEPLILFYGRYFKSYYDLGRIEPSVQARFTTDRRAIEKADAVVFHLWNHKEFGDARKYPGQIWVAWSQESSQNVPLMSDPAFMGKFDLRMTYEKDADVWDSYLPKRARWEKTRNILPNPQTSGAPIVMFQSSSFNLSGREEFVRALARNVELDSYGRFLNNKKVTGTDRGPATKLETIANYPFCIAFENSICDDYVTEKLFEPLLVGSVPLYLGASNAVQFAPPNSFIDVTRFGGPEELADYLRYLLQNPKEYQAYLRWRAQPFTDEFERYLDIIERDPFHRLVELVRNLKSRQHGMAGNGTKLPFGLKAYLGTKRRRWTGRFRAR